MDLNIELNKRTDNFNKFLRKSLKNGQPINLYNAARHLPLAGGKRLRPCISLLTCEAVGGNLNNVMPLAVAIELIHNFTLVHDDIMDNSKIRRNIPTVHIKYDLPTAIIAGDLLFTKAFEVIHDLTSDFSIYKEINFNLIESIREICEGQMLDMDFEKIRDITEDEYLEMIRKKTAVLFRYAARSGAIIGGGTNTKINALSEYGEYLGLSFQIHDDYLDMCSNEETLGKDIGNDIRNGKKTLIAVHALNIATGSNKRFLEKIFGNSKASDYNVKKIFNLFNEMKSVEYARDIAMKYSQMAIKSLEVLDYSYAKDILIELAKYAINREK